MDYTKNILSYFDFDINLSDLNYQNEEKIDIKELIESLKNAPNGLQLVYGKTIDGMSCHKGIIGKTNGRGKSFYKEKGGINITTGKTKDGMSTTSNVLLQFLLKNKINKKLNKIIRIENPIELDLTKIKNINII